MRNDMEIEIMEPQINADERRFVNLNLQRFSKVYQRNTPIKSPQSTQRSQRSQSSAIPVTAYETAPPSRRGTRMTQIGRIFTDRCASVSCEQSVFYRIYSLIYENTNPQISQIRADLSNGGQTLWTH